MNEKVSRLLNNPLRVPISVGVVSFGAGVGLGYILGRRNKVEVHEVPNQLEMDFNVNELAEMHSLGQLKNNEALVIPAQEIRDEPPREIVDIPEYKKVDGRMVKVDARGIPEDAVLRHPSGASVIGKNFVTNKIKEAVTTTKEVAEEVAEEVVTHTQSIFAKDDDEWNYAKEVKNRTPAEPYVIHKDEFYSEEKGYTQSTFVYYSGDNIMCDEDDSPVYNHDQVTGPLLFGHGSGDPNVVHIRNDNRKAEYEILYDPGLYSQEVLGLEIENNQRTPGIEHSKTRQFRLE